MIKKLLFLCLLFTGCAGPTIYVRPYQSEIKVDVYTTGKPTRTYTELGFIAVENTDVDMSKYDNNAPGSGYASFNPFEAVKKEAKRLGADAVIIVNPSSIIVGTGKWVQAVAIKYN
jgi:hypothetical protein